MASTTAGQHSAFFYGTLMSPKVLYRVIYGTTTPDPWQKERLTVQPALLLNYRRHRVKHADYPGVYPMPESASSSVLGTIVTGLSDADVFRLDLFEGDQYDRKQVKAFLLESEAKPDGKVQPMSGGVEVMTYVFKTKYRDALEDGEWDFEEFRREKLGFWIGEGVTRDDYEGEFVRHGERASFLEVDEVVASLEFGDPTGGRGKDGKITKQLEELDEKGADEEPLKSAV